jgi:AraC family transcriptional regulator of adaptative response/methylated-DNA-[protein]-cysteine methyltransferase
MASRPPSDKTWAAIVDRDEGIFCRPSCASKKPRREHVRIFSSIDAARAAGYRACKRCEPTESRRSTQRIVERARRFLERHADRGVTLAELGRECAMSASHLQRVFTGELGVSPKRYHDALRTTRLRKALGDGGGAGVSRAIHRAGYGSSSRVYERAAATLGMSPAQYGGKGKGMEIQYVVAKSPLGAVLVAFTSRGVCRVALADTAAELERGLRADFGHATIRRFEGASHDWARAVINRIEAAKSRDVPIDVAGTEFQREVWAALEQIPRGETRSYAEVAAAIGRPTSARAVARACATNEVAVLIPCHRVVRGDGSLSGYRWGVKRKSALLANERRAKR